MRQRIQTQGKKSAGSLYKAHFRRSEPRLKTPAPVLADSLALALFLGLGVLLFELQGHLDHLSHLRLRKALELRLNYRFNEIGFILQSSNLIPFLNVTEQLKLVDKMAKRPFQKERAQKLLAELALSEEATAYPNELSGGERQRVAIVRALYNDPSVILADEPTASLDTPRSIDVVERLAKEAHQHNKAIVMVTHDQRLISHCDVVYRIEDGVMTRQA